MPRKTTILIIILLLFTIGLVYIAIQTEQQAPSEISEEPVTEDEALTIVPTINPQTDISFSPSTLNTAETPQNTYSTDVMVNTNGQDISGIQLELSYDPEILSNVTVTPSENNLFGPNPAVLVNSVDEELGRISFTVYLGGLNEDEINGTGSIATINFSTNFSNVESTQISMLPKTNVTSLRANNSLLRNAEPLTISLSPVQTQENNTPISTQSSETQPF